jgi:hypothetical protein
MFYVPFTFGDAKSPDMTNRERGFGAQRFVKTGTGNRKEK